MALAAPTNVNLTVPNVTGHTYEIFQIFTGDLSTETSGEGEGATSTILSNIKWGKNGAGTEGTLVEKTVLDALAGITSTADAAKVDAILAALGMTKAQLVDANAYKPDVEAGSVNSVPTGYYIVKDKDESQEDENDAYSLLMIEVVGPTELTAKMDTPEVEKKVKDVNDSTGATTDWQDSADYDIGDEVPFQLTATLANNVSSYKQYHITFVDTLEAGKFSAISDLTIKVDGVAVGSVTGFNAAVTGEAATTAGFEKTITFTPATGSTYLPTTLDGKTVTVEFTATLGTGAAIGSAGNANTVELKFSNNPNDDQGGEEGKTPPDKVKVFTYKVDVNKVQPGATADADPVALTGANFTLYKEVAGTSSVAEEGQEPTVSYPAGAQTGATIKATFDASIKATALDDAKYYVVVGNKTGDAAGSTFEFKGVDDGNYVLVETTVPTGYNAWESVAFTIEATHATTADDPTLTSLTGGDLFTGNAGSVTVADGTLETNVLNQKGSVLPSTGGIGTTIFYVVGSILVVAAGVLLITKKRMSREG